MRVKKATKANVLRLLPGAPKARGFLANSEHPHQATYTVTAKPAEGGGITDDVRELHVILEFKLSQVQEEAFAIAEAVAAAESSDDGVVVKAAVAAKMQWPCNGVESVDRYWGVARWSLVELRK